MWTKFWLERLGKKALGRPRHRLEDNIKRDVGVDWIHLAQDRDCW
jgi:hypothetical protein